MNTFVSDYLMSLLDAGGQKSKMMVAAAQAMITEWIKDTVDADIGDLCADTMDGVLRACRVVSALVFDAGDLQDELWADITFLGKLRDSSADTVEAIVAVGIANNDFYNSRMTKLPDMQPAIQKHNELFVTDRSFWESSEGKFAADECADVIAAVRKLSLFAQELPALMAQPVLDLACQKVKAILKDATQDFAKLVGLGAVGIVQELANECTIAYSLDSEIDELNSLVCMNLKEVAIASTKSQCIKLLDRIAAAETDFLVTMVNSGLAIELDTFCKQNPGHRPRRRRAAVRRERHAEGFRRHRPALRQGRG